MTKPQDQITNLMDLLKIPEEKRNFNELRNRIQNLIEEKDSLTAQIESKDNDNKIMITARYCNDIHKNNNKGGRGPGYW